MTIETQVRNLQLRFDQVQHNLAQLTARFEQLEKKLSEKEPNGQANG
jgi:flagellar biosynthesis chaperone FliJ